MKTGDKTPSDIKQFLNGHRTYETNLAAIEYAKSKESGSFQLSPNNDRKQRASKLADHRSSTKVEVKIQTSADSGFTALHLACRDGAAEKVQSILKSCPNVNVCSESGDTPVHIASKEGKFDVVIMLKKAWADMKCTNNSGNTPLHEAILNDHTNIAEYLIGLQEYRSSVFFWSTNNESQTPFSLCINQNFSDLALLMLNRCYSKSAKSYSGVVTHTFRLNPAYGVATMETYETPLGLVVQRRRRKVLDHIVFRELISEKWECYGQRYWLAKLLLHLGTLIFLLVAVMYPEDQDQLVFGSLISATILHVIFMTVYDLGQFSNWQTIVSTPWPFLSLSEVASLILSIVFLKIGMLYESSNCLAFSSAVAWVRTLHVFLVFPVIGTMVQVVLAMVKDINKFMYIYIFFWIGFSLSFHTLLGWSDPFATILNALISTFVMLLGNVDTDIFRQTTGYVDEVLLILYMTIGPILLLNMIIAMMASSFEEVYRYARVEAMLGKAEEILQTESRIDRSFLEEMLTQVPEEFCKEEQDDSFGNCDGSKKMDSDGLLDALGQQLTGIVDNQKAIMQLMTASAKSRHDSSPMSRQSSLNS